MLVKTLFCERCKNELKVTDLNWKVEKYRSKSLGSYDEREHGGIIMDLCHDCEYSFRCWMNGKG